MNITIVTDSNCDLPLEYITRNNIHVIPFTYELDRISYTDDFGNSLSYQEFYNKVRGGSVPTTAQITPYTFENQFRELMSRGVPIIYVAFSSALSETYNSALMAMSNLMHEDAKADISIIDSRCATVGQGLLVRYACEMRAQGKTKQYIVDWLESNKLKINHWFTIDSLDHLKRGGRISAASAAVGGLLELKPVLNVLDDGSLNIVKKVRGRKSSIRSLYKEYEARVIRPEEQVVYITHGDSIEDAEYLKSLILGASKPKEIIITILGPIIGAHTGPGMICIAFWGKDREG